MEVLLALNYLLYLNQDQHLLQQPIGTVTTVYDVYNMYNVKWASGATTGILANLEWGDAFGWQWWGGSRLSVVSNGGWITDCPEMTGNTGMFISIKDGPLAAGASNSHNTHWGCIVGACC